MLLNIEGIEVDFPYEPYDCQTKFMKSVINSLKNNQNALLESPTGTGKTLSLLCATLAFVQSQKQKFKLNAGNLQAAGLQNKDLAAISTRLFPQIIYASRTHSQLKQVVRELNKTKYKSAIQVAFLAGREHLCLDKRVQKEQNSNAKSQICRTLIHSSKCIFHNKLSADESGDINQMYSLESNGNAMDIEDLVEAGKKFKHCPFFRMRKVQPEADLVLLPYNYILDPKVREMYSVKLQGNILIFDEAHNLSNIAEESISISISTADVALCIREVKAALEAMVEDEEKIRTDAENAAIPLHILEKSGMLKEEKEQAKLKKEDVATLLMLLQQFDEKLAEFWKNPPKNHSKVDNVPGQVFSGETLLQLLNGSGFLNTNSQSIGLIIDRIGLFWTKRESEAEFGGGAFAQKIIKLPEFSSFISRVFSLGFQDENVYDLFRLYVQTVDNGGLVLNYWCFSAQIAMRHLQQKNPLSIILASGTLAPMDHFIRSMGIPFFNVLENEHAAKSSQVMVRPTRYASNRVELIGTFQNREAPAYVQAVGEILFGIASNVPQGMLVFFASYAQMNKFLGAWKVNNQMGISRWSTLQQLKTLCVEPSNRSETQMAFREFDMAVRESSKGAIMFAVCRGKMSEGIDFADCHCRAVIVIGIPYPPLMDSRIILKKRFLQDRLIQKKGELSPDEWYRTEAVRAVNQALGRIIRHKDDFGVVILADSRFANFPQTVYPAWIRASIKNENDPKHLFAEVRRFFTERSLLVEQSQAESSFQGSLTAGQRRRVTVMEDTRTKEECQFEAFLATAKMYGVGKVGNLQGQSSSTSSIKPAPRPTSQPVKPFVSLQKRKLVLKPNSNWSANNGSKPPLSNSNVTSENNKEPDSKRVKP